jgi:mediator of RNA polymerase II transcription subunit 22
LKLSEMSDIPQSDVSRPSKLPTAKLLPHGAALPATDQTPAEYLEAAEEEWNKRVDVEIETLAEGMVDLVNLASVSSMKYLSVVLTSAPWPDQQQG